LLISSLGLVLKPCTLVQGFSIIVPDRMPAQDEEGRFEVIDGTAEELPPDGEDPATPAE
jgi:hypothetical protein